MEEGNKEWTNYSAKLLEDPDNLELWQSLVEAAETNNKKGINKSTPPDEIKVLRETYDNFLDKYPLLFNYWIKLADWEFKLGNSERADEVFKHSLQYLSYSLDIWTKYLTFKLNTITDNIDEVLDLFETARWKIGKHFHAYEFYQLYIQFLEDYAYIEPHKFKMRLYVLYRQVIEIPLYHYEYFFKRFMDLITLLIDLKPDDFKLTLSYLVPPKELNKFSRLDQKQAALTLKKTFMDAYITNQYKVYEMFAFEKHITQPYFDVKYLPKQQLDNWSLYIDFLKIKQYPEEYVNLAFERCLIVTASYPQFWIKFANFKIASREYLKASEILMRGFTFNNHYKLLLKLVDINVILENYTYAKDLLVSYIQTNISIPVPVYEKLICIERILAPGDQDHLLNLFREIISETKNGYFFEFLLLFNEIAKEAKIKFLEDFDAKFKDTVHFKLASEVVNGHDKVADFAADYETEINRYL